MSSNLLHFDTRSPSHERRRQPRMAVPNIRVLPSQGTMNIINMSRRGMAIETHHPFTIGGDYLFELCDEGRSLVVEGRVRWSRTILHGSAVELEPTPMFRTGVAFVGVQPRESRPNVAHLNRVPKTTLEERVEEEATFDRIDRLARADNVEDAGECLLDLLEPSFERLVLFRAHHDCVRVWMGRGQTLIPERLRALQIDFDQPSIFLHLHEGGRLFFGSLPSMIAHRQLVQCWDGMLAQECALFPIWIKSRLVAVLYADAGHRALTARHLGQIQQANELFSESVLNQILRRKAARRSPPN